MAQLKNTMPDVVIPSKKLKEWGARWKATGYEREASTGRGKNKVFFMKPFKKKPDCFDRYSSVNFCQFIDEAFGKALANFLGDIPVLPPNGDSLLPPEPDCVEVGSVRIVGGIRPQNYDAAYRPDGPRVVLDSKSLNDQKSIRKNWQNMINDLATEAATIHTRFPFAVVCFMVVLPRPALDKKQEFDIIRTLERLGSRSDVLGQHHLAEAIALVVWDPETGKIDPDVPGPGSNISLKTFSEKIAKCYVDRYKGLPPHAWVKEAPEDLVEILGAEAAKV